MQTHVVTRVIDGDTVEVSPEIPRRTALQTPMERLIGVPIAETPTQGLEDLNGKPGLVRFPIQDLN